MGQPPSCSFSDASRAQKFIKNKLVNMSAGLAPTPAAPPPLGLLPRGSGPSPGGAAPQPPFLLRSPRKKRHVQREGGRVRVWRGWVEGNH